MGDDFYVLTEEGKKYLKRGLPEKNLAEILSRGPIEIGAAKKKIENFDIALMWGKKKNIVAIKGGLLHLLKKIDFPEEKSLDAVSKGLSIDEKIASVLMQRKLIEKPRETIVKRAEKQIGKEVASLTEDLIKTGLWKSVKLKPYNVEAFGRKIQIGKRPPYNKFLSEVRQKLIEMGFIEMTGPSIETEFWNFDALFQPQNHPSRDWTQTYSLKYPQYGDLPAKEITDRVRQAHENGWKTGSTGWKYKWDSRKASRLMPRAHGTAISARTLTQAKIPGKYFAISRCYRPDVIDVTHGIEFNQTEGIVLDESLNFRSLLGILKEFAIEFAGSKDVRFYSDYYPFTEPSVQLSARHPELGWVELGGAGIFREELTKPLGVNVPVIAWGLGVDRLAMFKLGINDIRDLFSQNLEWLRKQAVV